MSGVRFLVAGAVLYAWLRLRGAPAPTRREWRASSLVGFNRAAIDDLARAVYFSRQSPFYVHAVLESPFLQEARPELVFQCRHSLSCPPHGPPNKV